MYNKKLEEFIVHETDDVCSAYWNYSKYQIPLMVVDENDKFVGIVSKTEFNNALRGFSQINRGIIADITNYKCTIIPVNDMYKNARNVFGDKNILYIPVVDEEGNIHDLFSRKRAFYLNNFWEGRLERMNYATLVWAAANDAVKLGKKAISVIEFGVAGGNGLLNLQFHAREIGRLLGIDIEVYGFDTGEGLPDIEVDYRDIPFLYRKSNYKMNFDKLISRLEENTKLIIGDVKETGKTFVEQYHPAPIAAIMLDVDFYSSAQDALEILNNIDYESVMPRVYMWADDIESGLENIGENLAIKEFNKRNDGNINISPEGLSYGGTIMSSVGMLPNAEYRSKICHFFRHPDYNKHIFTLGGELPIASGGIEI